ncbi:unnamed protein product, partial [Heligmosomoides polygyrus]|uniref:Vanin-like protein 1 n=1 Tax=Heligmosomoides polygyrus TaxID=6339 RepID=A0A183FMP5_HELPZ
KPSEGEAAKPSKTAIFRINRKPDGFIRSGDAPVTRYFHTDFFRHSRCPFQECEDTFQSFSCDADNQWVAGIAPLLKVNSSMTALQCCTYEPLRISSDRGLATVKPGQIVIGGEVHQYAFDYVSNIEKTMNVNGTVTYYVNMRRFYCPDQRDLMPQGESEDPANRLRSSKLMRFVSVVTIKPATSNSVQDVRRAPVAYQVSYAVLECIQFWRCFEGYMLHASLLIAQFKCEQDPHFTRRILWTNEATFKLNGDVNWHYCSYWTTENVKGSTAQVNVTK